MDARGRGPMKFLGVAVTALALVIALHLGSPQQDVPLVGATSVAAATSDAVGGHTVRLNATTNLFVPGTGNPGELGSANPGNQWVIAYPATPPVLSDYPGSVRAGVTGLNEAVATTPPGSSVEVGGFSQGAHVANQWAAAQPGVTDGRDVTLVTTGDPCTARTGILVRSPEARAVAGPCAPLPPEVTQVVIVQACDPIANFPEKIDLLTVANALAGYTYCHSDYGTDQLNRPDIYEYQEGSVTYRVIPAGPTSPLVRAMHQNGVFLPADVEAGINAAVAQSGPGPHGGAGPAPVSPVHEVSAPVDMAPPPDPAAQAVEAVESGWQDVTEDFTAQVENFVATVAAPAPPPWTPPPSEPVIPTGNVAAAAGFVQQYVPAPEVAAVAAQVEASPIGGFLNGLPPLPFG